MDNGETYCTNCNWTGSSDDLVDYTKCPKCNKSLHIVYCDYESNTSLGYLNDSFNWNKA